MSGDTCHGRAALGPCDKTPKYAIVYDEGGWRACGIHMPQLVKRSLRTSATVTVFAR